MSADSLTTSEQPRPNDDVAAVGTIVDSISDELASAFAAMSWAEHEIKSAQRRHPAAAERIWRSFTLLRPTLDLMATELVYRAHCRELLDRVAAGVDTRPGTAAECCIALCETTLHAPLRTSAVGLYARMWREAGLPPAPLTDGGAHYEALSGSSIDEAEQWLRGRLCQPWRALPTDGPKQLQLFAG